MTFFRSVNPLLSEKPFIYSLASDQMEVMTLRGSLDKFLLLYVLSAASASIALLLFFMGIGLLPWLLVSACIMVLSSCLIAFYPGAAPFLAPLNAMTKGFALGGLAAACNHLFDAVAPAFPLHVLFFSSGTLLAAWFCFRWLPPMGWLQRLLVTCCAGLATGYLFLYGLGLAGIDVPFPHEAGWFSIAVAFCSVLLTAFYFLLDHAAVRYGSALRAPRYMEWYSAFGLSLSALCSLFFWKQLGALFRWVPGYKSPFRTRTS